MDIYEPVIAEMKAQIEECQRVIVTLEMMRAKGTGVPSSGAPASAPGGPVTFSNDAFFGMTIAEGSKKYLATTKKTANAKTIADALVAGGFKTSAKNFVETVRSILTRNQMFALVNGEFGLSDWYPGRKAPAKKGGSVNLAAAADSDPTPEEVDAVIAQVSTEPQQPS